MRGRQSACCFTGHRPGKLPWRYNEEDLRCVSLKARIADAVEAAYQEGFRHFLCGMPWAVTCISASASSACARCTRT